MPDFRKFQKELDSLAEELAAEFYSRLISNIKNNRFGFELAKNTINKRLAKGNTSETPLVDTGDYLRHIRLNGAKVEVFDGRHYSGLTYFELSFILEHGRRDKGIGSFPVWRLTFEEFKPIADAKIDTLLKKRLQRKLR